MKAFCSERLNFKLLSEDDYGFFSQVFSSSEVMHYALIGVIDNELDMHRYFNQMLSRKTPEDLDWLVFVVFHKHEFIGIADFEVREESDLTVAEIGYFLLKPYWQRGFATEIGKKLTEVCFFEFGAEKVYARCNSMNTASENVMKKIGMVKDRTVYNARFKHRRWFDEFHYCIEKKRFLDGNLVAK